MGLIDIRKKVVEHLELGCIQHEARDNINVKNLLKTGAITVEEVIKLIKRTKGTNFSTSSHHTIQSVDVHTFKSDGWYIKCYLIEPDLWFISAHK